MVIPCLKLRNAIAEKIKLDVEHLKLRGISPCFAIILIGNDPASEIYIKVKSKKAEELGITTQTFKFQTDQLTTGKPNTENREPRTDNRKGSPEKEIEKLIEKLNRDHLIHGIIIQRPIAKEYDEKKLQKMIDPQKDIDGLSDNSPFVNPLVQAVEHAISYTLSQNILRTTNYVLRTVVVGKGKSAGSPIYEYFSKHPNVPNLPNPSFSVSQIDSKTPNPTEILKSADIIISCVGKERIINAGNINKGVILIGVGQHQSRESATNSKLKTLNSKQNWKGDYEENEIKDIAAFYTRTPGGIGPLNVIFLLKNVVNSAQNL